MTSSKFPTFSLTPVNETTYLHPAPEPDHKERNDPPSRLWLCWTILSAIVLTICFFIVIWAFTYLDYTRLTLNPFFLGAVSINLDPNCSFGQGPSVCYGPYSCANLACEFEQDPTAAFTTIAFRTLSCQTHFDNDKLWELDSYRAIVVLSIISGCFLLIFIFTSIPLGFYPTDRFQGRLIGKVWVLSYAAANFCLFIALIVAIAAFKKKEEDTNDDIPEIISNWDSVLHFAVLAFFVVTPINTILTLARTLWCLPKK